ncbi:MAG: alpha-N-arabinofuranosidase [Flavisolibacter sp.]
MKKYFIVAITALALCHQAYSQNKVVLNTGTAKDTINKNIYGHFAEHLGHGIYGGFYVGDNKKIPNKNGIRLDVIEALKKLKVPVLRWPGGCFADHYHWKDAVGPKSQRKPIENMMWGNVREDNSFGTNEFLDMCELLGADPYLAVNMGGGTVEEAIDWVKYVNHPNGSSYLTDMRQKNGRAKPWNVRYWGVGNESWDCGGHMDVDYYVDLYKRYATMMTTYGNSEGLYRIAVGPGTDDFHWTEVLMRDIPRKLINGVSIHHYSVIDWSHKSSATGFTEDEYFRTMQQAYRMEDMIKGNSDVMDKYDPEKKVGLVVDEWGGWYETEPGTNRDFLYQQNSMRDAMIAGLTLNIFNNHCDRVKMANLAQTINVLQSVILTNQEKLVLTPTYHVMEMYNVHQNAVMIPVSVTSGDYIFEGKKLKAVSASASKDRNGILHISLVNIDAHNAQNVTIDMATVEAKTVTGRILRSEKLQDYNSFTNPNKIKPQTFSDTKLTGSTLQTTIPPFSVVVLELK